MAELPPNRVKVNTVTTGQGASVTLGAAVSGLFTTPAEAGMLDGHTYDYVIEQGGDYEHNSGVYTASGSTIARGTPISSKISGAYGTTKLNLAGSAYVYFPFYSNLFSTFGKSLIVAANALAARVLINLDKKLPFNCQLVWVSGSQLQLNRFNGNGIFINGQIEVVPSTGPTLAVSGLTNSVLYYVYAYMSGATLTLEASATAPAADATYGHQIKSGDATRTLVGMAYPLSGAFQWGGQRALVRSYYNNFGFGCLAFTTITSTNYTAGAGTQNITGTLCEFLTWTNEIVDLFGNLWGLMSVDGGGIASRLQVDGSGTAVGSYTYHSLPLSQYSSISPRSEISMSQGYHTSMLQIDPPGSGTNFLVAGNDWGANTCSSNKALCRGR